MMVVLVEKYSIKRLEEEEVTVLLFIAVWIFASPAPLLSTY